MKKLHLSIILVLFISVVILSGCTSTPTNNAVNNQQTTTPTVSLGADFCEPQNLKLVIPDRIDCIVNLTDSSCLPKIDNNTGYPNYTWIDGTQMLFSDFHKAHLAGQNVNYLYGGFGYGKTPVSQDGTIGEKVDYEIDLAINPSDSTSDGYKVVQYRCCKSVPPWDGCTADESYNSFS